MYWKNYCTTFVVVGGSDIGGGGSASKMLKFLRRALDKREYSIISWNNFSYFSIKPYVVTPHLNGLFQTVHMRCTTYAFN